MVDVILKLILASAVLSPAAFAQTGRLEPGDATLDSGEYFDVVERDLRAGVPVTISLTSTEFDPYLIVLDPNENADFQADDSAGQGLNVREVFTPTVTGTHLLIVTSAWAEETGSYALGIEGAGEDAPANPLAARKTPSPAGAARVFEPRAAVTPPIPTVQPEPGYIKGVAVDRHGNPLAGASVVVYGTTIAGENTRLETRTQADGTFRQRVPDGIYGASAYVERAYAGERFEIRLPAADGSTSIEHDAAMGGVENFVWHLEGLEQPGADVRDEFSYHGMYFTVQAATSFQGGEHLANATLEVTLTPAGPLIDGSEGQPLVYRHVFAPDDRNVTGTNWGGGVELWWDLLDIPLGSYTMTARLLHADGTTSALRVSDECCDATALQPSLTFHPTASSIAHSPEPFTNKYVAP